MNLRYCIIKNDRVRDFNRYWWQCRQEGRPSIKAHLRGKSANVAVDYFTTADMRLSNEGMEVLRGLFFDLARQLTPTRKGKMRYSVGERYSYFFGLPRELLREAINRISLTVDQFTVSREVAS
jgi:hypothetical protein